MRKYFGTDGIRRIANTELTPELVYKVAKAGAYVLSKHANHAPTILIGMDTRISGTLIESAMTAGFLSYGANVKLLGVIPTPGVAYLTKKLKADASVVISASHNTYDFNGVKFFSNKGMKIPDELEEEIEEVKQILQQEMEQAASLEVPLVVDMHTGENWYEAKNQCEILLAGTNTVDFWLQLPDSREAKIESLELTDIPKRPERMTRLSVMTEALSDSAVKVTIRDLGFGEIYKSSEKVWEYKMEL